MLFLVLSLAGCGAGREGIENVLIKGSDTEVNLALALSESYMERDSFISIAVTGGGSGMGIAALINGKTDIANSSRPFKPQELALARERGVNPVATVFAVDAIAIIVHEKLDIGELSILQLQGIFSGSISNWQELGGPDLELSLYGRQSNSGTFIFFRDSILKQEYALELKQMNGTAQIVEAIKSDRAGIGYVGLGYLLDRSRRMIAGVKALSIRATEAEQAFSPVLEKNITKRNYPIIRPLFQYTDGIPSGKVLDYIRFSLSEEGQHIVEEQGYYRVAAPYIQRNRKLLGLPLDQLLSKQG